MNQQTKLEEIKLSRVIQGYWRLNSWNLSKNELVDFIQKRIDIDVTSSDHADIYGDYTCEELFGDALKVDKSLRKKLQIITKTGICLKSSKNNFQINHYNNKFDHIIKSLEQSLKNFSTDYIDLLLIHRPSPLMDIEQISKAFNLLKKSGKVNNFGVSNFEPKTFKLLQSALDFKLVTNQIELSPLNFDNLENGTVEFLELEKITAMIWAPLAGGAIFDDSPKNKQIRKSLNLIKEKYQAKSIEEIIYAWIAKLPLKTNIIVGSREIERLKFAQNGVNLELSDEDWFILRKAFYQKDVA